MKDKMLNIALPKGRLGEKVYKIFEAAGFGCDGVTDPKTRKLIFENHEAGVCYFWVKPSDVAIYVERGAADVGVAGKDILLEYSPDVYELFDLGIGKCRMCVAAKKGFRDSTDNPDNLFHRHAAGVGSHRCDDFGRVEDIQVQMHDHFRADTQIQPTAHCIAVVS